ncbi:MAG: nucleotidyl transferase AbiEii/AbiGii toxin family protein [candidate division WOR-3 bacterium]|nr:nucleotidyl transferase AbiEii/AbiGii toxin family protein [candidate division WOR-3 bacterium]
MITQEQIQELVIKKKIDTITILREYLQLLFLKEFYNQKESQKVYFRGGTAIHLLFSSTRFSMDLDFTSELATATLKKIINRVFKTLSLELANISLKPSRKKLNHSFSLIMSYLPKSQNMPLNILLDFSLREKPMKKPITAVLKTDFPIIGFPIVLHLNWTEILAEKIRAILIRGKGRDLYDVYYLINKNIQIDWQMVSKKMAIYPNWKNKAIKETLIQTIKHFNDSELRMDLRQFLPRPERERLIPILKKELLKII